jgi:hypothetical protein
VQHNPLECRGRKESYSCAKRNANGFAPAITQVVASLFIRDIRLRVEVPRLQKTLAFLSFQISQIIRARHLIAFQGASCILDNFAKLFMCCSAGCPVLRFEVQLCYPVGS